VLGPAAMAEVLRAGVIGAGVFGGYHARQYAGRGGVALAGVFDVDPERARAVAGPLGAPVVASLAELIAASDVVSVCSPASAHAEQALAALQAGKGVYVEKPLAADLTQADRIIAEAARRNLVCASGHLERAVFRDMGLFAIPERPLRLEAVRNGPRSPRSLDVSVVLDLMIHDLDLALLLAGAEPLAVEAEGGWAGNETLDHVRTEVVFDNGLVATCASSRVAEARERTMHIVYPSGEVRINFVSRAFSNTTPYPLEADFLSTPGGRDPLGASLSAFLAAVRGQGAPLADALAGAKALDLALCVEQAVED
jgi:predicted dehydrogenase